MTVKFLPPNRRSHIHQGCGQGQCNSRKDPTWLLLSVQRHRNHHIILQAGERKKTKRFENTKSFFFQVNYQKRSKIFIFITIPKNAPFIHIF